ncbi:MAG: response regulator transcription factor [Bacteroidota bacterium]
MNPTQSSTAPVEVIDKLGISQRELEVLQQMSHGFSNKEIADKLFIAESTVKTHVSSLLVKLHAKRRTEAIHKARDYRLID